MPFFDTKVAAPGGGGDPDVSTNLKVYYEFEDDGTDEVGSNDLTENGTVLYASGGIQGKAFDPNDSGYFTLADNADIGYSGDFSVQIWYKGNRTGALAAKGQSGFGNGEWALDMTFTSGRAPSFTCNRDAGGSASVQSSTVLSNGPWHHIVGCYTASTRTIELYVNGTSEGTTVLASAMARDTGGGLYIGNELSAGNTLNAGGDLDAFGLWKEALTSTQIAYLYNSGSGRTYSEIAAT